MITFRVAVLKVLYKILWCLCTNVVIHFCTCVAICEVCKVFCNAILDKFCPALINIANVYQRCTSKNKSIEDIFSSPFRSVDLRQVHLILIHHIRMIRTNPRLLKDQKQWTAVERSSHLPLDQRVHQHHLSLTRMYSGN